MSENRRQILQMLSEGKISAEEADLLIAATTDGSASEGKARPKYLRVQVDSQDNIGHEGPTKVNIRVPMQLLRAGVKLAGLIPAQALRRANDAIHQKGIAFDLTQIKPENLEDLIEQLSELSVDVDQADRETKVKVKVFCE